MKIAKVIMLTSILFVGANANNLCGNGVKDLIEQCDPTDSAHKGWGNKGCSEKCKQVQGRTCDQTFYYKLRYGKKYRFTADHHNNSNVDIKMKGKKISFRENHGNLDGKHLIVNLDWVHELKEKKFIIKANTKVLAIKANDENLYDVAYYPIGGRHDNDVQLKYEFAFTKMINGREHGYFYHITCVNYEATRCGDGIIDNYTERGGFKVNEACDDGNNKSGDGCSSTCQLEK